MINQDLKVIAGIQERLGQLPVLETLIYIDNNTKSSPSQSCVVSTT